MANDRYKFAIEQRKKYHHMLVPTIDPSAHINYQYVELGDRVWIQHGCVIGEPGVGYIWDKENKEWLHIPQVGRVLIGDDVHIFPRVHILRGTVGDTTIGRGSILGHQSHIGHNVVMGENCLLAAFACVTGSCVLGDEVYLAPRVTVKDHVKIADRVLIGQHSNVLTDCDKRGWIYYGNPAKPIRVRKMEGY